MDNLEARVAQLEADLHRYARQNRRIRLLFLPCLLLAGTPFLFAWKNSGTGVFETITAESLYIEKNGKRVIAMTAVSPVSPVQYRGKLQIFAEKLGAIAELGGVDGPYGELKLAGPKKPRYDSQIELGVSPFGDSHLAFNSPLNTTSSTLSMGVNSSGGGSLYLTNPKTRASIFSLGMDSKGDSELRMADSQNKTTVVLDALPRTSPVASVGLRSKSLPGRTIEAKGGGGRFTLTDPNGTATFQKP